MVRNTGGKAQILLAEDSRMQRRLMTARLNAWGFGVEAAEDGAEALARFVVRPFAVVISDWNMPHLDGPGLFRALRRTAAGADAHLVLLTCRAGRDDVEIGTAAGADIVLSKPVSEAELRRCLAEPLRSTG